MAEENRQSQKGMVLSLNIQLHHTQESGEVVKLLLRPERGQVGPRGGAVGLGREKVGVLQVRAFEIGL